MFIGWGAAFAAPPPRNSPPPRAMRARTASSAADFRRVGIVNCLLSPSFAHHKHASGGAARDYAPTQLWLLLRELGHEVQSLALQRGHDHRRDRAREPWL